MVKKMVGSDDFGRRDGASDTHYDPSVHKVHELLRCFFGKLTDALRTMSELC